MYRRKHFSVLIGAMSVLALIILASLVYAGFTGQLNITGTAVGRESNWDIHFENVSNITTSGTAKVLSNNQPTINSNDPTEIEDYEVSLTSPSDSISFTFDVVNEGNYNAKITSVNVGTPQCASTDTTSATNMCNNLTYTLKYSSGATINQNSDIVYAKDKVTMKVTLTFNDINDASLLPTAGVSISNLGIQINFEQEGNALVNETTGEAANNKVYHQGDKITLNNEDYYVIENSGADKDYVVALKENPLTVAEVNLYGGVGTESNHVNRYTQSSVGTALNNNGFGATVYYSSESCGYVNGSTITTNCTSDYDESDIKYVVDAWALAKFQNNELKNIENYSSRLIKLNELYSLGCTSDNCTNSLYIWIRNVSSYWTMTSNTDKIMKIVSSNLSIGTWYVYSFSSSSNFLVRPVINVKKSALETNNN